MNDCRERQGEEAREVGEIPSGSEVIRNGARLLRWRWWGCFPTRGSVSPERTWETRKEDHQAGSGRSQHNQLRKTIKRCLGNAYLWTPDSL